MERKIVACQVVTLYLYYINKFYLDKWVHYIIL